MMCSPLMRIAMMVSWFVTSLACANMLLMEYDYDIFKYISDSVPGVANSLPWVIGICGLFSLVMFVMMLVGCGACNCHASGASCKSMCAHCGSSPCVCNKHSDHNKMRM
jgi:hypothetical protein